MTENVLACRLHTGASVAALQMLRDALCKGIPGELTRMWVNATDERKWHRGAVQALMKASLFVMPDVDACIAKVTAVWWRLSHHHFSPG